MYLFLLLLLFLQIEILKQSYSHAPGLFNVNGECTKLFGPSWERTLMKRQGFSLLMPTSKNSDVCDVDNLCGCLSDFHAAQRALQLTGKQIGEYGSVSPIAVTNRDQSPVCLSSDAKLIDAKGSDYIYELGDKSTDSKYRDCRFTTILCPVRKYVF